MGWGGECKEGGSLPGLENAHADTSHSPIFIYNDHFFQCMHVVPDQTSLSQPLL